MAKNARQRRAAKRKLALALLAHDRNPMMIAREGIVRSVWSKTLPSGYARVPFHGKPGRDRSHERPRFALDGWPKKV